MLLMSINFGNFKYRLLKLGAFQFTLAVSIDIVDDLSFVCMIVTTHNFKSKKFQDLILKCTGLLIRRVTPHDSSTSHPSSKSPTVKYAAETSDQYIMSF